MKYAVVYAALTVSVVNGFAIERRQGGILGGLLSSVMPKARQPASKDIVPTQLRKDAVREIIRWGPYELQAANATRAGGFRLDPNGDGFNEILDGLCKNCYILSGSTYLTFENKSMADVGSGVYNHHVFVGDVGKSVKNYFECGKDASSGNPGFAGFGGAKPAGGKPATPAKAPAGAGHSHGMRKRQSMPGVAQIFGSGDDGQAIQYVAKDSDTKIGFYVGKTDTIFSSSEFVNYRKEPQKVFITFDIEYMPGKPAGWSDAGMGGMSATGCSASAFNPAHNQSSTIKSPPYTAKANGVIFQGHAHLHDGGDNVKVIVNGKEACNSKAYYGGEKGTTTIGGEKWETIQRYDFCPPIEVKTGDKIVIEGTYDLVKHRLRPGASDQNMMGEGMAMLGFVFAPKV